MNVQMNPLLIMMCGPTCAGKSTLARRLGNMYCADVLGTDMYIKAHAEACATTYRAVFEAYYKTAHGIYNAAIGERIKDRRSVILDRTHISGGARRKILSRFPLVYDRIAVCVGHDVSASELMMRCDERVAKGGHDVPVAVIARMHSDWAHYRPTLDEGFEAIFYVNKGDIPYV